MGIWETGHMGYIWNCVEARANEYGYINTGVIPKFAGCVNGVNWFRERGQWADNSAEPTLGMIIFFDWNNPSSSSGPQDGLPGHVGIVEKVENDRVYTIEGNSGDSCRERSYLLVTTKFSDMVFLLTKRKSQAADE